MSKGTNIAAVGSLMLSAASAVAATYVGGLWHELLISLFGTFSGAAIAILAVNIYLSQEEKKYAAGPLVSLIQGPVNRFHNNLFIQLGRDTFGIQKWNSLIDQYDEHNGNPDCFSPEDKNKLSVMIDSRLDDILECIKEIEISMSDLISVLSWSFDAKIVGAAILCKQSVSEFRINITKSELSDKKKKIEFYFDIDANGNGVLHMLAKVLNIQIGSPDRTSAAS